MSLLFSLHFPDCYWVSSVFGHCNYSSLNCLLISCPFFYKIIPCLSFFFHWYWSLFFLNCLKVINSLCINYIRPKYLSYILKHIFCKYPERIPNKMRKDIFTSLYFHLPSLRLLLCGILFLDCYLTFLRIYYFFVCPGILYSTTSSLSGFSFCWSVSSNISFREIKKNK